MEENVVDIHLSKLVGSFFNFNENSLEIISFCLDWFIERRHCPKDWNQRSIAIRAKINESFLDLPNHQFIDQLLNLPCSSRQKKSFSFHFFSIESIKILFFFFFQLDFDYFSALKLVEIT